MKKKETPRQMHKLFVRVANKKEPIIIDENGNKFIKTKWVEVKSVNLGSRINPNKEVIEFKFEPIRYEDEERSNSLSDIFGGLFGK